MKFDNYIELDSLFVSPEYIGKGFGNLLMTDFLSKVNEMDFDFIKLTAEPFAEIFYKNMDLKRSNYSYLLKLKIAICQK